MIVERPVDEAVIQAPNDMGDRFDAVLPQEGEIILDLRATCSLDRDPVADRAAAHLHEERNDVRMPIGKIDGVDLQRRRGEVRTWLMRENCNNRIRMVPCGLQQLKPGNYPLFLG